VRLPDSAHSSQPWRIHELTPDFRLEDVWALPTPGGPDDFPSLLELLGWDEPDADKAPAGRPFATGCRTISARVRPAGLARSALRCT
jgi:hypothetical protein